MADDDDAEVNVRVKLVRAEISIRPMCTQCFGREVSPELFAHVCCAEQVWIPRDSVEILAERVQNRPWEVRDDEGGILAIQMWVSLIIDLAAVSSDSSWEMALTISKRDM